MKKKLILITAIFMLFLLPMTMLSAQSTATGRTRGSSSSKFTLTVTCNIAGATVSIPSGTQKDSSVITGKAPFSVQLDKGTYSITVSAPNYISKTQYVNLENNQTVNFNLEGDKPSLSINCNVTNAAVAIGGVYKDSSSINGTAPFTAALDKGQYTVTVSAPGYVSQSKQVNLSASTSLNFNLEVENYSLSVTSNVVNAKVQIKGSAINGTINGNTSYSTVLPPGSYQIKVNAPGYFALDKTIVLNVSQTVDFQLQPKTARLNVVIPNGILNYTIPNPAGQIKIFDNGSEITGNDMQLNPGQHTIRIVSGAFAAQQTINVKAGETYSFDLNFGFTVNKN